MQFSGTIAKDRFLIKNFILFILAFCFLFTACQPASTDYNKGYADGFEDGVQSVMDTTATLPEQNKVPQNDPNLRVVDIRTDDGAQAAVPQKAYQTLAYIQKNNEAPDGYAGGRHFGNYEHRLPERDAAGNKIAYREWDINPKTEGKGRGPQRLVTGSDGRAWYTGNHYQSFTEIRQHADIQE